MQWARALVVERGVKAGAEGSKVSHKVAASKNSSYELVQAKEAMEGRKSCGLECEKVTPEGEVASKHGRRTVWYLWNIELERGRKQSRND